jgi:glycosyltransferase involved in cell wall biosynthesis
MKSVTKKIYIIFHGRYPSEKAASLFAAKSAESFATQGYDVTLLVPRRLGREKGNPYEYYAVENNFRIVFLPCLDVYGLISGFGIAFILSYISFSVSCLLYLFTTSRWGDIVYSNELLPAFFTTFLRLVVFYEMHDFPESKITIFNMMVNRMNGAVIHNEWKVKKFFEICPQWKKGVLMERNAVDVSAFSLGISQTEARRRLGIDFVGPLVVYTGHLYGWKGVSVLAEAATMLPDSFQVAFVGGTEIDVATMRSRFSQDARINIVGHRPHAEIPLWQQAASVLVLPNSAKENISKYYTSPMKLFEYMASGRPIIASDIPSIAEILNKTNSFLIEADNPVAIRDAIIAVIHDAKDGGLRSNKALLDVQRYSWSGRAKRILGYLGVQSGEECDIVYPYDHR